MKKLFISDIISMLTKHKERTITAPDHSNKDEVNIEIDRLRRENEFMLRLLVDIERAIDHDDQQQITVAIKRLRTMLGTKKIMDKTIQPGLERK